MKECMKEGIVISTHLKLSEQTIDHSTYILIKLLFNFVLFNKLKRCRKKKQEKHSLKKKYIINYIRFKFVK